jgi:uncharacterized membrane protein YjjP (DUF1212 family)
VLSKEAKMAEISPQQTKPVIDQLLSDRIVKPFLEREVLADIVDLALTAGQLLMQNGAESQRVEETIRLLGTGLGCDWGNVLVSYNAISLTYVSGAEFRSEIRRIGAIGANMSLIEAVSHLAHRVEEGKFDRLEVRAELGRIRAAPRHYNRWVTALAVGLACAAFSLLFGGDGPVLGATLVAAVVAMLVRQELTQRKFNELLVVVITAVVAGGLVGLSGRFLFISHTELALAASALFMVPGIPFINAVEDLIKGHILVGLARGAAAALIILSVALGLILAVHLTGIKGL